MSKSAIIKIRLIIIAFLIYFSIDFPVRVLNLSYFDPCYGLKSFLPVTIGLFMGYYGVAGEVLAVIASTIITKTNVDLFATELIFVIIPGFVVWLFWNFFASKPSLSFKVLRSYIKFVLLSLISFVICSQLSFYIFRYNNCIKAFFWYTTLTFLVGLPMLIMYRAIFCVRPVIPKKNIKGEDLILNNDIVVWIDKDSKSINIFNELFEDFAKSKAINMKKIYETQNLIEELYIRIIKAYEDIKIQLIVNYDITFSIEMSYNGKKYNPLKVLKTEDEVDVMGIKLIKHRAIISAYKYMANENYVHVVT